MAMELFVVKKNGVYIKGVVGIFSKLKFDEEARVKAAELEKDGYHDFDIQVFELDKAHDLSDDPPV